MPQNMHPRPVLLLGALSLALSLSACGRVSQVGRVPAMTEPESSVEFQAMTSSGYGIGTLPDRPDSTASLWSGAQNSLVADRRATSRGDILTVVIEIDDRAEIQNSSGRSRSSADKVSIPSLMGLPQRIDEILPDGASMDELAEAKASSSFKGSGNISRRDKLTLRVAATVVDRLPNGVLKIQGTQEVRVNYEVRELTVSGFVRPSDIGRRNEIAYDRIAGARISYGGRGQISDVQQPRYGQQIADILLPY
ncbi:flagellar basal body L-ring protein FlgH [Paracoccus sp. PS-1]|uniref:flagellar basal body L-ring protein FlgH n=1 Tax=unclassified Paracoccus (in: a-proteobacteria) TaxID=2688777 RepID=UPI0004B271DF|nr:MULTISPECIES: flagellar basal body L-ring protein FlgH [unclassified Paracoccus (in: a-proteobacteria)]MDQ7262614.1 flagellar basal body L-ring protein FlgH [Paracoccus sp. PS1]RQP06666.1 MAG: flagellar basal body L-ring protein FlgH [Paracoccus sp. BP8]